MKHSPALLLSILSLATASAAEPVSKLITPAPTPSQSTSSEVTGAGAGAKGDFQVAFGRITIGDKEVATAVEWNTRTGEARMLNAATLSDKESGQQGNIVGWIPLGDLQQAVQNLASQIQKQQADSKATNAPAASGAKTP